MRSTSGTTGRSPTAILAIILVSYFMILLDNSVVFTGLPSIRADLELGPTALSWVQDAYTLVFGGLLLLSARALQGISAAIVAPTSLALITAHFQGEARTRAVAWYGATAGIGASLGLVVGGDHATHTTLRLGPHA